MNDVISYKCPCCGASLKFDSSGQELKCSSCGNSFPLDTLKQFSEAEEKKDSESFDWSDFDEIPFEPQDEIKTYICKSCGAEILADKTASALSCPYCGSAIVLSDRLSGALKPNGIIPFKIDESKLNEIFKSFCKNKPFAPKNFFDEKKIKEVKGIYVPFWLFDCNVTADINYNAVIITHRSDSRYNYTITDHFLLKRSGSISFEKVPADGSLKMDDTYMEAIEPFDYSGLVAFETGYLSGFMADKFDVDAKTSIERANARVKQSTLDEFRKTTSYYMGVTSKSSSIASEKGKVHYVLLPVWILNAKYNNKMYTYAVNGQTGKIVGNIPVSMRRFFIFAAVLGLILSAVSFVIIKLL